MALVDDLIKDGWLKTPKIIDAFRKIKRLDFLLALPTGKPEDLEEMAEFNEALSIGFNQTISQPLVVALMLELLEPKQGDKILDIGSGSGYTSALLGEIAGQKGKVTAIEIIPELKEFGEKNAEKYGFVKKGIVEFICGDGSKGYKEEAPYDKILASASVRSGKGIKGIPSAWKEQLKINGRIVTPIENSIWLFVKKSERGDEPSVHLHSSAQEGFVFEETEYPGFAFVPLVSRR